MKGFGVAGDKAAQDLWRQSETVQGDEGRIRGTEIDKCSVS